MLSDELLNRIQKLSRAEKLRVVQLLVNQLAEEETLLTPDREYPIFTPLGNEAAAQTLWEVLKASEAADDQEG